MNYLDTTKLTIAEIGRLAAGDPVAEFTKEQAEEYTKVVEQAHAEALAPIELAAADYVAFKPARARDALLTMAGADRRLNEAHLRILLLLVHSVNDRSGFAWPGLEAIAEYSAVSRKTAGNRCSELARFGYIVRTDARLRSDEGQPRSRFALVPPAASWLALDAATRDFKRLIEVRNKLDREWIDHRNSMPWMAGAASKASSHIPQPGQCISPNGGNTSVPVASAYPPMGATIALGGQCGPAHTITRTTDMNQKKKEEGAEQAAPRADARLHDDEASASLGDEEGRDGATGPIAAVGVSKVAAGLSSSPSHASTPATPPPTPAPLAVPVALALVKLSPVASHELDLGGPLSLHGVEFPAAIADIVKSSKGKRSLERKLVTLAEEIRSVVAQGTNPLAVAESMRAAIGKSGDNASDGDLIGKAIVFVRNASVFQKRDAAKLAESADRDLEQIFRAHDLGKIGGYSPIKLTGAMVKTACTSPRLIPGLIANDVNLAVAAFIPAFGDEAPSNAVEKLREWVISRVLKRVRGEPAAHSAGAAHHVFDWWVAPKRIGGELIASYQFVREEERLAHGLLEDTDAPGADQSADPEGYRRKQASALLATAMELANHGVEADCEWLMDHYGRDLQAITEARYREVFGQLVEYGWVLNKPADRVRDDFELHGSKHFLTKMRSELGSAKRIAIAGVRTAATGRFSTLRPHG